MNELIKLGFGIIILILGIPIGKILAKTTKEELKSGQKWFKLIILFGLILGVVGLILGKDVLLFTGFFIAIVAGQSLRK